MREDPVEEHTRASEHIYRGRVVNLRLDTVELPNGTTTLREIVEHRGSVAMVPVDGKGRVIFVRQYRKAAGERLLEIPAGTLDGDEDVLECVQRELQEETGYLAGRLEKLFSCYVSPGYTTELVHIYLCSDLTPSRLTPDLDEAIEAEAIPLDQVPYLIASGQLKDAKSIAALLATLQRVLPAGEQP